MKKILALTLALMMMFALAACGGGDAPPPGTDASAPSQDGEMQGYTGGEGASLADVDEDNYAEVAQELFGIDVAAEDGWSVTKVESPNKVNNLTLAFAIPEDADGKALVKKYFDATLAIAEGGNFTQEVNWDTMSVSQGESYTDFDAFFAAEVTNIDDFFSAMWLYDFDGKSVQCSVSTETGTLELSLTLLG
ncbi:MAG: hypothetical protein Q4B48_05720 [Syntrophomonadaceae bacterium]|nr:hypothetical protein [Syntrophomonadaceae bacterium]